LLLLLRNDYNDYDMGYLYGIHPSILLARRQHAEPFY
jgi:hypothetical protein